MGAWLTPKEGVMPLPDELKDLAKRVSNWGRWGDDDQRGTLHFITPDAVRRGVAAVRRGVTFALSIPYDEDGPQTGVIPGRINPKHTMIMANAPFTGDPADFTTSDDLFEMGVQAATHWDALAHVGYEGLLYNNTSDAAVTQDGGAERLGIEHYGPIVTRGVLLDVARLKGVEYFDDDFAIGGEDLAAVATDTLVFEVWPSEDPAALLPVHMIDLRDMGLVQGQLWHLDELAADCATDGVHELLLAATPLPIT